MRQAKSVEDGVLTTKSINNRYTISMMLLVMAHMVSVTPRDLHIDEDMLNDVSVLYERVPLTEFPESKSGYVISLHRNRDQSNQHEHHSGGQR